MHDECSVIILLTYDVGLSLLFVGFTFIQISYSCAVGAVVQTAIFYQLVIKRT